MTLANRGISIILPTKNEAENIINIIDKSFQALSGYDLEIIIVDDNSTDQTVSLVESKIKKDENIILLKRKSGCLASALQDGLKLCHGETIFWMDADFSHPPDIMPIMLKNLEEYDAVIASRFVKGGEMISSRFRVVGSTVISIFGKIVIGKEVTDYTSGFIAIRRNVIDRIGIKPIIRKDNKFIIGYGEYFIRICFELIKHNYKILEVPYIYKDREFGESKTSTSKFKAVKFGIIDILTIVSLSFMRIFRIGE